ncbi:cobalamin-binding protein [Marinobacter nanhaiticus D15-8W]|uniref:Cobalamin-binding protein n=1 Tax=Marinobacter nanhaiticus D15-8W TaxID=626887 RepID=N6WVQ8_9GAMM|nr:cobalamin-binding protein [Marinobacter nanhaiticus]ENO15651.1 cobalamin-binding protein [Marinobacter nanhaiticus D15-8W]BES73498.1 cobalamin-binding protein [Marinobacter nanhaiticus D15-8W]
MPFRFRQGVFLLVFWGWASLCAALTVTDDTGVQVTLDHPPQRIVSLAPHATELLFSLGLGSHVVGVSEYSDYPPPALDIPRVGRHNNFNLEKILALKPDLILAWASGNGPDVIKRLRDFGFVVFALEPETLTAVPDALVRLGHLTGKEFIARKKAAAYRNRLEQITERYADHATVRVFYQVWDAPLMTLAGEQYVTDAIARCGGQNIFADMPGKTATVGEEAVLARAPELILAAGDSGSKSTFNRWRALGGIPAVEYDQLVLLPPDLLARPTLRLVDGLQHLCQAIEGARRGGARVNSETP